MNQDCIWNCVTLEETNKAISKWAISREAIWIEIVSEEVLDKKQHFRLLVKESIKDFNLNRNLSPYHSSINFIIS